MSLRREEIYTLVCDLKHRLAGAHLEAIKEIAPLKWIFILKTETRLDRLLVCLQATFARFHLLSYAHKGYESPQIDVWTSILQYAKLEDVEMLGQDRILKMLFKKGSHHYSVIFEVFPQRPNLYLLDSQNSILQSLKPSKETLYTPPANLKAVETLTLDPLTSHSSLEKAYEELEGEAAFKTMKAKLQGEIQKKIKKNIKHQNQNAADLERCQQWSQVQHEGLLLQANRSQLKKGMHEIKVSDWEQEGENSTLILDERLSPQEQIASRFKLSKKLKSGQLHHQKFRDKLTEEFNKLELQAAELEKKVTVEALKTWASHAGLLKAPSTHKPQAAQTLPYREFKSASGYSIWVGKNAQSNDKVTFSYAKGSDWWLHVRDYPGSHVIIRTQKKLDPDEETMADALQLAIAYSKAKDKGDAEVCVSQCKFVSRLGKNQPGKVQISQHKIFFVKYDPARFQNLKNRTSTFS